ncbi:MAG: calcium/proton exchanger [Candidatus Kaiserbacteria bacterium]|nr:calcium/proton exchanger [Candidatus Kaiserbacteria bacterium]
MDRIFLGMLAFIPLTLAALYSGFSGTVVFFLAALSIVPLAKYIGDSTEELASRTNPAIGGILNATFGNATELIIGFFALQAGLVEVVKASITGSIIGNLLLVLGLAMFMGGLKREHQKFNRAGALASASTLLLSTIALILPAIFAIAVPGKAELIEPLSLIVSFVLLIMYAAQLYFILHTHRHLYTETEIHEPKWSVAYSITVLSISTMFVALMSEVLVGAIEPVVGSLGWSTLFIGVIFIAIIGNAAEHYSAVTVAMKNRMDLALHISVGSATQIALFVAPALVLASIVLGKPMNLIFEIFELVSIVFSVLVVNFVVADGESNWLEGAQLLAAYVVIGVAFFFHP